MTRKFPEGLLSWAGHREGGVRRLFQDGSGKPSKDVVKTQLVCRLEQWARDVVQDEMAPRVLILAGGPGNGKTEALEYVLEQLDENFEANGSFVKSVKENVLLPSGYQARKVQVDLNNIGLLRPLQAGITHVEIVQDATSSAEPGKPGARPEELFASDIEKILSSNNGIYIAAVNRGILASTLALSHSGDHYSSGVSSLLEKITSAITISASQIQSWPLQDYPGIAAWAMDIESLFERVDDNHSGTPAHSLFKSVLDPKMWENHHDCIARKYCPFRINQEALSDEARLDHLLEVLRFSELQTGKRWSFRDLFSLMANMIVGHESDFSTNGVKLSPCEWVRENAENLKLGGKKNVLSSLALSMRLYHHALFPGWPTSLDFFPGKEVDSLLKETAGDDYSPSYLFQVMDEYGSVELPTELRKFLKGELLDLDPAMAIASHELGENKGNVNDLEEAFCFSVEAGYEIVKESLLSPEQAFLDWLVESEKLLNESVVKKTMMKEAALLKATMRCIASRFSKRSLGLKLGFCRNHELFHEYRRCDQDHVLLANIKKVFSELLNPGDFQVSLKTTFGQPVPSESRDVLLETDRAIVKYLQPARESGRPYLGMPYLELNQEIKIPLSFSFYQALKDLYQGLLKGCLPSETTALVEGTKAKLAGILVNKPEMMQSAQIKLGETGFGLRVISGHTKLEEVD